MIHVIKIINKDYFKKKYIGDFAQMKTGGNPLICLISPYFFDSALPKFRGPI